MISDYCGRIARSTNHNNGPVLRTGQHLSKLEKNDTEFEAIAWLGSDGIRWFR